MQNVIVNVTMQRFPLPQCMTDPPRMYVSCVLKGADAVYIQAKGSKCGSSYGLGQEVATGSASPSR